MRIDIHWHGDRQERRLLQLLHEMLEEHMANFTEFNAAFVRLSDEVGAIEAEIRQLVAAVLAGNDAQDQAAIAAAAGGLNELADRLAAAKADSDAQVPDAPAEEPAPVEETPPAE